MTENEYQKYLHVYFLLEYEQIGKKFVLCVELDLIYLVFQLDYPYCLVAENT